MVRAAYVNIWGRRAGAVSWDPERQLGMFEYDRGFLDSGWDLSPLQMPLELGTVVHAFPELRPGRNSVHNTFRGMPGMLADVLPDRYGNQLIQNWLSMHGRAKDSMNPVELLCFIGSRGMGALEFEPANEMEARRAFNIEIGGLVDIAKKMLAGRARFETNLNQDEADAVRDILKIGTSAGGARPKAIIAYNEKTGEVRSGQTLAPAGFEHWLIKLDGVHDLLLGDTRGYGRVEMAYYLMATACGIDMMPCRLLEENGRAHFMTRRFDREGGNVRHHIQSFCAMQHFDFNDMDSYSYEVLFETMRELHLTYPEAEQMFRRMAFNIMARNCDDHTRNFAFRLRQGHAWELAPAFDICHAYRPDSIWVSRHFLSLRGKREGNTRQEMLDLARQINVRKPAAVLDEVREAVLRWKDFASQAGVDPKLQKAIQKTLLPL